MKKIVAVTGGTGFIGGAVVKELLSRGYGVRVLSRKNSAKSSCNGAEIFKVDYDDVSSIKEAVSGCFALCHIAAALFAKSRVEFERANVGVTANIVSACMETKPERFIYLSSLSAGGPSRETYSPRDENCPDSPVSDYGRTKLLGEKEVLKLPPSVKKNDTAPAHCLRSA
ncbi:MAG: NAD-dependent epimerase/dehydratase family protein [Elusimicrobia bacterium]|nr:NAD-dependent epimerase/dehydratase family protein [Elusimicrobiota bacterium]